MVRRAVRSAERAIGGRLERAVESRTGAHALSTATRLTLSGTERFRGLRAGVAHMVGFPARRDVSSVSVRIALLERKVDDLTRKLDPPGDD